MTELKLYHYSKEHYNILKTREAQGIKLTDKELKEAMQISKFWHKPGLYSQHISLFFEPVPLDILGKIYGPDHHTWFPGNELYEYVVLASQLGNFKYEIVESPLDIKMFYDPKLDSMPTKDYADKRYLAKLKAGEVGNDPEQFIKAASAMVGLARPMYNQIKDRPNWTGIKDLYAATVPHVMIYPELGTIDYKSVKKVKVGLESIKPIIAKW